MELISELEARIKNYVRRDKRDLKSLIWLIFAPMTLSTVNFTKLAQFGFDDTKATSRYRKIQRFFAHTLFDYRLISQFIFYLFDFSKCAQYVTMDRTNWSLGSFEINILFLCIEWHGERLKLSGQRRIYGCLLYVSGARSPVDGELMIVVSNVSDEANIDHYLNRWPIECLFGCLKSKGFNFELTKFKRRDRIKKLIVVLAISYCWALKTGVWRHYHEKKIVLKKHGRKAKSFFRYGLDYLQEACLKWLTGKSKQLKRAVALFQYNNWSEGLCHV